MPGKGDIELFEYKKFDVPFSGSNPWPGPVGFRDQRLEILPLAEQVEVGILLHMGGVFVANGNSISKHGHRLIGVELRSLRALFLVHFVVVRDDRAA